MGWTYTYSKPANVKQYMDEMFTWSTETTQVKVLKSAIVGFKTYYAAIECVSDGKRSVTAAICLLTYAKNKHDDFTFGYKDMDETAGPNECKCPESILDLLTDIDSEYANRWRAACRGYHETRKKTNGLKNGDVIKFNKPIQFTSGDTFSEMKVIKRGRDIYYCDVNAKIEVDAAGFFSPYTWYRIPKSMLARRVEFVVKNSKLTTAD